MGRRAIFRQTTENFWTWFSSSRGGSWLCGAFSGLCWAAGRLLCFLLYIFCAYLVYLQRTKNEKSTYFAYLLRLLVFCLLSPLRACFCVHLYIQKKKGRFISSFLPVVVFGFSLSRVQYWNTASGFPCLFVTVIFLSLWLCCSPVAVGLAI